MAGCESIQKPGQARLWSTSIEVVLSLVLLFCCVGSVPPGVNESHYLPKAKYAWDSSFARGGDVFLQSSNSHWLASSGAGLLSRFVEFSTVAWIGRLTSWILLSIAWNQVCCAIRVPGILRPTSLLAWFLWNHYGNWAGEWFVGGFEAKSVAYPCVLFGLASLLRNEWNRVWIWTGAAMAWHPVVGGWALLGYFVVWLRKKIGQPNFLAQQASGIVLGAALSVIGILPALEGISGSDLDGNISAAQVHCYYRLAHHLAPQTFEPARNLFALASLIALFIATLASRRLRVTESFSEATKSLLLIAWTAVLVSAIGWLLDRATVYGFRQDIAARLLRFYFFRWSDVAVPLIVTLVAVGCLSNLSSYPSKDGRMGAKRFQIATFAFTIVMTMLGVLHWRHMNQMQAPAADMMMLKSVGPVLVDWDSEIEPTSSASQTVIDSLLGWATSAPTSQRYADWLAVCQWIRENTPPDSLWLTPKHQQTFKWYACRAEVVNWKDIPQDSPSIIEWYRRIQRCQPPRDRLGMPRGWTTDELLELARKYRFQWVLIDRSYQESPPLLESKYPNLIDNRSFAVFYISDETIR